VLVLPIAAPPGARPRADLEHASPPCSRRRARRSARTAASVAAVSRS
jgi:hypothetical protein